MLKYVKATLGRTSSWWTMPFAASVGLELAVVERLRREFRRQELQQVELAIQEREPLRPGLPR